MNDVPFLARKITRAKWGHRDILTRDEIPADAVTADLRTSNNMLSVWKCKTTSDEEINKTVLALATAAERVDKVELAWVEENVFRDAGISMNPSEGKTPVVALRGRHVDVEKLNLGRLSTVAMRFAEALAKNQYRRLTRKDVIAIVVEAVRQKIVLVRDLEPKVKEEVEKAFAN